MTELDNVSSNIPLRGVVYAGPYKGYFGRAEYDSEENEFSGTVTNIRDVITFIGSTPDEVRLAFQESIDEYLAFCAERDEKPEAPSCPDLL